MKKVLVILALLFLGIFVVSYSWAGEVRVWTSGKHTAKGEFVKLTEDGSIVLIRKTNGKVVRVPLAKLSQEDQEYVKDSENHFEEENTETAIPVSSRKAGEGMVKTVDGIDYAFRWCPPGEFMMGEDYEKPVHKVKITKGFWLLETEVTQAMWQSVMGWNLSNFKDDQNPVECVNWHDSQEFCKRLSQKLGQQVKLPTEEQWEYACHAGTGAFAGNLDEMAWHSSNSGSKTHAVGQKKPNAWGLYDMIGNVLEWCSDDPENTAASSFRPVRGGCWRYTRVQCRWGGREDFASSCRYYDIGLRVLVVPSPED